MQVINYKSHQEHCKLYSKTHGIIAVNGCQIGLGRKDIILLSDTAVIEQVHPQASKIGI